MGLDMCLEKKTYVKNWDYMTEEQKHEITIKKGGKVRSDINPDKISYVVEEVAVWRKANQIHKWFVENVQDGNDDCKEYYVSARQLQELLDLVNKVLDGSKVVQGKIQNGTHYENGVATPIMEDGEYIEDATLANELLPTGEGFFFGSTNYDQWYLNDLKYTKEVLEEVLADENQSGEFYYSSSW